MRRGDRTPSLGVLDWGIGGMGFVRLFRQQAPGVPLLYVSDTGATPYGQMTRRALAARVAQAIDGMYAEGAVGVVVACNAASTVIDALAPQPIPVVGIIECAKDLAPASLRGVIGVLGGARTIRSGLYRRALAGPGRRVVSRIAQPLSAHIEAGTADSSECAAALDRILGGLHRADAVVLACTHYPAIAPAIRARAPAAVLLDPADALVSRVLRAAWLPRRRAPDRWTTTGDPRAMREATRRAWGFDPGPCARWPMP
jgi:glutamate racemase